MKTKRSYNEIATTAFSEIQAGLVGRKLRGFHVQQSVICNSDGMRFSGSVKIVTDRRTITISGDFSKRVLDLNKSKAIGKAIKSVEITKGGLRISTAPSGVVKINFVSIETITIDYPQTYREEWEKVCGGNLPRWIADKL